MTRVALAAAALALAGCGRGYSNFTLPILAGADPDLRFELRLNAAPVISPSVAADSHDALNPSVAVRNGAYYNYYSGYDGNTWSTLVAQSSDGLHWSSPRIVLGNRPDKPDTYIAANGSALCHDQECDYWYVAGGRNAGQIQYLVDPFRMARSRWVVLLHGPFDSWDERAVADPYVIRLDPYWYMYYLGQDRAAPTRQRIGLARSDDNDRWQKLASNPILEAGKPGDFDEAAVGEPAVFQYRNSYWMFYTGNRYSNERTIGLARSSDGVHWTKLPLSITGRSAWNSKVLCDPTVLVEGDTIRVWFGGGDVASLDENLHGQIGYGVLQPVSATLGK